MKITGKAASPLCADCGHERHFHRYDDDMGRYCYAWNCGCKKFVRRSTVFKKAKEPKKWK